MRYHISIEDVRRTIYEKPALTQTEIAQELGTTRFVVGYRLRDDRVLGETLRIRSIESKNARKKEKPIYIVRANGDEYCTPSLRELGEYMFRNREAHGGILNVRIQRRPFSTLPKINSVAGSK